MPDYSADFKYWNKTNRCPRCQRMIFWARTYKANGEILRGLNPKDPTALVECRHCHGRWFKYEQPLRAEFLELEQSYEVAKVETMTLDNRRGTSPLIRKYTISEEWSQQYDLERESTETNTDKVSIGIEKGPGIEISAEQSLKEHYAISERSARNYSDEITIDVPPGILRKVIFTYKHTIQHGKLRFKGTDTPPAEVSYRVVVDMNLDLTQEDSTA